MANTEIKVPDIGDFDEVEVIEVLVNPGDTVAEEQPLITLESDKASMDIPSPMAGTIASVKVSVGDRVAEGTVIAEMTPAEDGAGAQSTSSPAEAPPAKAEAPPAKAAAGTDRPSDASASRSEPAPASSPASGKTDRNCEVLVLGAGPGGYTAAFRAADLGKKVILVERSPTLGGVCLNVGCIPSKALLHAAEVINSAREMAAHGVSFGAPSIDRERLAGWKSSVVGQLTKGLAGLAKQRKVEVVEGSGRFSSANSISVEGAGGTIEIGFEHAIIAAGSEPVALPMFPNDDARIWDSTDALELGAIPDRLLVVGGGIIGLEMASVYAALGSKITVVELLDGLMPGADRDLVRPFQQRAAKLYENIYVGTKVTAIEAREDGLLARFEGPKAPSEALFDNVLVAVGRKPNGKLIGAEHAGVAVDDRGFIAVDRQQRTNVAHIFAIGDVVGQPMLAHKATHEGKVAAEVAAGLKSGFDALCIPSVAYTDPEVAWVGLTEEEAKQQKVAFEKGVFPWAASGRALGIGRSEGLTKLIFDEESGRLLGAGIVGPHAGDLIAEAALAIEMGADAADIGMTIHPHPTLSETLNFAAEMVEGTITDLYAPRKPKKPRT